MGETPGSGRMRWCRRPAALAWRAPKPLAIDRARRGWPFPVSWEKQETLRPAGMLVFTSDKDAYRKQPHTGSRA